MSSSNLIKLPLAASVLAGGVFLLQGCGGGDGASTTAKPSTAGTTTTTTTTRDLLPKTPNDILKYYNDQWLGYSETNDSSPLGVIVSYLSTPQSLFKNIFCADWPNPVTKGKSRCHVGGTDCRISTGILNNKVNVHKNGNAIPIMNRTVAVLFHTETTLSEFARCSYMWDGATQNRLNNGCGAGAGATCPTGACTSSDLSAFCDICQSTHQTCKADDTEVKAAMCKDEAYSGGTAALPEQRSSKIPPCFFPGVALDYHNQSNWTKKTDFTREMLKKRISFNNGTSQVDKDTLPNIEMYTEVVVDTRLWTAKMLENPRAAVLAFLYVSGTDGKGDAVAARNEYASTYKITDPKSIPVLALKLTDATKTGPFELGEQADANDIVI